MLYLGTLGIGARNQVGYRSPIYLASGDQIEKVQQDSAEPRWQLGGVRPLARGTILLRKTKFIPCVGLRSRAGSFGCTSIAAPEFRDELRAALTVS